MWVWIKISASSLWGEGSWSWGGPPHEPLEKEKVLCPSSTAVDTLRPHKHPHPRYPKKENWEKIKRKYPKMNWVLVGFHNTKHLVGGWWLHVWGGIHFQWFCAQLDSDFSSICIPAIYVLLSSLHQHLLFKKGISSPKLPNSSLLAFSAFSSLLMGFNFIQTFFPFCEKC